MNKNAKLHSCRQEELSTVLVSYSHHKNYRKLKFIILSSVGWKEVQSGSN